MVKVITVEREFGSGGPDIAKLLADKLGWKLWDQTLTTEIARRAQCERVEVEQREERTDPLSRRGLNLSPGSPHSQGTCRTQAPV